MARGGLPRRPREPLLRPSRGGRLHWRLDLLPPGLDLPLRVEVHPPTPATETGGLALRLLPPAFLSSLAPPRPGVLVAASPTSPFSRPPLFPQPPVLGRSPGAVRPFSAFPSYAAHRSAGAPQSAPGPALLTGGAPLSADQKPMFNTSLLFTQCELKLCTNKEKDLQKPPGLCLPTKPVPQRMPS
ncbi:uncharacterized protein LOC124098302 [Marmota monax]|uniref:uncharacterized protein LOC124098302 n=1 Tax=Marmota monax TaxID=9995 RepID=UPI001EB07335|nr:uncharacterized protein LOC124098302 [Marmota monax]